MLQQCYIVSLRVLANCCVRGTTVYTPVKIQSANNICITIVRLSQFNSPIAYIKYTSNMAEWFYARLNDATAPYVFTR